METQPTETPEPETDAKVDAAQPDDAPLDDAKLDDAKLAKPQVDDAERVETSRRSIEQQLAQLERKQAELKRALAMADHPDLADALREVEGRAYGVSRASEQLAQPLSKSEERQRAKLEKKLAVAEEKRATLDAQIEAVEKELASLLGDRVAELQSRRQTALHQLFTVLARHSEGFEAAGLQVTELVPELDAWLPELTAMTGTVGDAE